MYSSLTEGEKFCLRWNECEANLSSSVRDLRDNNELFDLTLACDDDHHIQVHRLVLSASSSFFRNLLRRLPQHNPLVYLKGIRQTDLQAVLSFVYNGEVNIAQQDLRYVDNSASVRTYNLTQRLSPGGGGSQDQGSDPVSASLLLSSTEADPAQEKSQQPPALRDQATHPAGAGQDRTRHIKPVGRTLGHLQTGGVFAELGGPIERGE